MEKLADHFEVIIAREERGMRSWHLITIMSGTAWDSIKPTASS